MGVLVSKQEALKLCFSYTGATIFNNYSETHYFKPDFQSKLIEAINSGVRKSGNVAVSLPFHGSPNFDGLFFETTTDKESVVSALGKEKLSPHNLDYVIVMGDIDGWCAADLTNQYSPSRFSQAHFYRRFPYAIYDVKTGVKVGIPSSYRGEKDLVAMPAARMFTDEEIQMYSSNLIEREERRFELFLSNRR